MRIGGMVTFGGGRAFQKVKLQEGRERVLVAGWIETVARTSSYADGLESGQAAAVELAEDRVHMMELWGCRATTSMRGQALRAAKWGLADPLSSYVRLKGFIQAFVREAQDPAYYSARFYTGAGARRGRTWETALCLKVLP